jgi:hypothetical protein
MGRIAAFAIVVLLALSALPAAHADPAADIEKTIRDIYASYEAEAPKVGPVFDKRLQALVEADNAQADGGEGRIDWDVFVNGQDFRITEVSVGKLEIAGDTAHITARFKNFDNPQEISYTLRLEDGRWLIDDIQSMNGEKWSMSELLSAPAEK